MIHFNTRRQITESEVSLATSDVKSYSAPGIDGISPKFVKMAGVVLTPILTELYNKCLQQECLAKNKNLIEEFITEIKYSPEVIGISETKINSKTCLSLNIPGFFFFFHDDSPTNA